MFGIKKLLFGDGLNEKLPEDVKRTLNEWEEVESLGIETSHFLTRYVVVDVLTDGMKPDSDQLLGIAASVVYQGVVSPEESIYVDLSVSTADDALVERQLAAFLKFVGKSPLVAYHVAFVSAFLQNALKRRLGVNFQPRWVDLAWLLPAMFGEKSEKPLPLDEWLVAFGIDVGNGRRSPMENNFVLARLLQMLVVRASDKGVGTVDELIEESKASSTLRRTH